MIPLPPQGTPARDERGATAAEYALLATLIAVAIIVGATALGSRTAAMIDRPCEELSNVGQPC